MVLVERANLRAEVVIVLPGLRNHHHDRMRKTATTEMQELQGLVETRSVRTVGVAHRQRAVDIAQLARANQRLAGAHPVFVAAHGVDLTIVSDVAVRVRQRPGRESVRGKARVHDSQRGSDFLLLQVKVEILQLRGSEHTLVDNCAAGQRREVHGVAARALAGAPFAQLTLAALTQEEHLAVEINIAELAPLVVLRGNEELTEHWHSLTGHLAKPFSVDRHIAPCQNLDALFSADIFNSPNGIESGHPRLRQEGDTSGVGSRRRQNNAFFTQLGAVVGIWHLNENAGTVAGGLLCTGGTAVVEIDQCLNALLHNVMGLATVNVGNKGHATRIMFVRRVVETFPLRTTRQCGRCFGQSHGCLSCHGCFPLVGAMCQLGDTGYLYFQLF